MREHVDLVSKCLAQSECQKLMVEGQLACALDGVHEEELPCVPMRLIVILIPELVVVAEPMRLKMGF